MTTEITETRDPRWRGLYLAAGVGALLTVAAVPFQIVLFIVAPPPSGTNVTDWFAMFQANPVQGILSLDFVMMVEQVLSIAIALALYVVLHRAGESTMALAAAAWLVAIALFIGSNTAFQMLSLSDAYRAAASEAERASVVAAGQAMLATYWSMGTGFVFAYVLSAAAGISIGATMLRSRVFPRAAGYFAIVGNVVGLAIFLPVVGIGLSLVSVLIICGWWALIGVRFVQMARSMPSAAAVSSAAAASVSMAA